MSDLVTKHASKRASWWFFYYHFLLYLHFILGIAGVIVGALVAAGSALNINPTNISLLGVASTVIVGLVSFVQPGRLASVFYDAYWRMRMAVLRSEGSPTAKEDLIEAMTEGYTRIATVQPEALRKYQDATKTVDVSRLSEDRRSALFQRLEELLVEEEADATQSEKAKSVVKVATMGDTLGGSAS